MDINGNQHPEEQPNNDRDLDSFKDRVFARRTFLASTAGVMGAALVLGRTGVASAQNVPSDLMSHEQEANPSWPFASDGLLYNYVSGLVASVTSTQIDVLVSNNRPRQVTVDIPIGTEVFCRGNMHAPLDLIKKGDRVEFGTKFLSQGVRSANWVVVNGVSGWSDVVDISGNTITLQPSRGYASAQGVIGLTIATETRIVGSDGVVRIGVAEGLNESDKVEWTGTANTPGSKASEVWGIVVNYLHQGPPK